VSEIDTYRQRIKDLDKQVCDFVGDIPAEGLNWRPEFKDVNSLATLASHIAGAQVSWIVQVIGQRDVTHDRGREFDTVVTSGQQLVNDLSSIFIGVDEVLESMSHVNLGETRRFDVHQVPIRWGLVHIIDHTALHFGQMQLTYQFWSHGQSKPSPLWKQRFGSS
jgi:uncharacterized damage-inducible protein DinB